MMALPDEEKNVEEIVGERRSTRSMKSGSQSPKLNADERRSTRSMKSGSQSPKFENTIDSQSPNFKNAIDSQSPKFNVGERRSTRSMKSGSQSPNFKNAIGSQSPKFKKMIDSPSPKFKKMIDSPSPKMKYTERKLRKRSYSGTSRSSNGQTTTKKYEVARICDMRQVSKGKIKWNEYLVRWKGYGAEEDQWLQPKHLKGCGYLMQKFKAHRLPNNGKNAEFEARRLPNKGKNGGSAIGSHNQLQLQLTAAAAAKVNAV